MQVSDYTQNGNSQMFFLSVLSAHYWDIFCIYMLLTFTATFFLSLDFRYTFLAFLLIHFLHYKQNNHLSKMYVLSRNASANNSDSVSIYGKSYNFSMFQLVQKEVLDIFLLTLLILIILPPHPHLPDSLLDLLNHEMSAVKDVLNSVEYLVQNKKPSPYFSSIIVILRSCNRINFSKFSNIFIFLFSSRCY